MHTKSILFYFSMLILAIGCEHFKKSTASDSSLVSIDQNLLMPWSQANMNVETAKSPALYEFKYHDKTLWYLASQHSTKLGEPVFSYIDSAIKLKPSIIILEGFSTDLGLSPTSISKGALQDIKDGFYPQGEPSYAIELAMKNSIPFIGGEPNNPFIYQQLIKRGYSANDLLSFDFIRRMPQTNRSGELKTNKIANVYDTYIKGKAKSYGYEGSTLTFLEFKEWYLKNQKKEFSLNAGEKGETAPLEDGSYYTQKISLEVTRIRDEHIINTISEMMNKYQNVLIIYGSSHYRIAHQALKSSLGLPKDLTPKIGAN